MIAAKYGRVMLILQAASGVVMGSDQRVRGLVGGTKPDDANRSRLLGARSRYDGVLVESRHKQGKCLTATSEGELIKLANCNPTKKSQLWYFDADGSYWQPKSERNLCIGMRMVMKECKDPPGRSEKQKWNYDLEKLWIQNEFSELCMNSDDSDLLGRCIRNDEKLTWNLIEPAMYGDDEERDEKDNEKYVTKGNAYMLDLDGRGEMCLSAAKLGVKAKLKMKECNDADLAKKSVWVVNNDDKTWRPYYNQNLCVETSKIREGKNLRLNKCRDSKKKRQQWKFKGNMDSIRSNLRRDLCIVHTTAGDLTGSNCCKNCNTKPCSGDNIKLGDAGTMCKSPFMRWKFHKVNV